MLYVNASITLDADELQFRFDRSSGKLEIDRRFGTAGAVDFGRAAWPHGEHGPASPHGAVFSAGD